MVDTRTQSTQLPADFLQRVRELESVYLGEADPIRQSGFSAGPERWCAERAPILEAITASGSLLDIGCANGYLLECLIEWGAGEDFLSLGLEHFIWYPRNSSNIFKLIPPNIVQTRICNFEAGFKSFI